MLANEPVLSRTQEILQLMRSRELAHVNTAKMFLSGRQTVSRFYLFPALTAIAKACWSLTHRFLAVILT